MITNFAELVVDFGNCIVFPTNRYNNCLNEGGVSDNEESKII